MTNRLIPHLLLDADRLYSRTSFRRGHGAIRRLIRWAILNCGLNPPLIDSTSGAVFEYAPEIVFDVVARELITKGSFEPEQTERLRTILQPNAVFVDVGANIGYFTVLASKWVRPSGQVFAFEPVPSTYHRLSKNMALNNSHNVSAFNLACFSRCGFMSMTVTVDSAKSHLSAESNQNAQVQMTTLDEFFKERPVRRLDCLKIDTEGADFEVLKGATEIIKRFRPAIILELDHIWRFGSSKHDVEQYLEGSGYSIAEIRADHSTDLVCLPQA
jgi:FkbM family methyltransferase